MASVEDRISLIKLESERLGRYLDGLSQDSLSKPSACEGWTVGDVVAHLVWLAEFCIDVISRGVADDTSPPEGFPPAGMASDQWINEYFAQVAIARREELGDQLLPTFDAQYEQLYRLMMGLSHQDWEKPCYEETRNRPAHDFIMININELVIHGWDIRSRLEPSAHLSAELLPFLMDMVQQRYRNPRSAAFLLGDRLPTRLRYRFEVTGLTPASEDILVEGDMCRIEPAGPAKADATFHCDTEAFVLLLNSRLTLDKL